MSKPQYNDPRWQRKRLEIMSRDGFKCCKCGAKYKTLHVHHKEYGKKLWEVPDDKLQTLCEDCHKELGEHPKAGVYWDCEGNEQVYCYTHCPKCGCSNFKDKGFYEKCVKCGHHMTPPIESDCCCYGGAQ